MNFYKYPDEEAPVGAGDAVTYIETDDNGCHMRQITVSGADYVASNVSFPPWGLILAEPCIDYLPFVEIDEVTAISQQEFDDIWQWHLALRQKEWDAAKRNYPVGLPVQGATKIFFPQGVIVDLGGDVLGVADHNACKQSRTSEFIMSTRLKLTAVVSGYDEINQWITLTSPKVYQEIVG